MSFIIKSKDAGFTLIEVLAALLIFSLAIIGLSQAGAQSAQAVTALDSKMLAGIVADNQLVLARGREVETGVVDGATSQLSRPFNYMVETRPTDIPNLFQITVKVTAGSNISNRGSRRRAQTTRQARVNTVQVLEQRIGFKSRPVLPNAAGSNPNLPDGTSPVTEAP